jgi:hypothetical protein
MAKPPAKNPTTLESCENSKKISVLDDKVVTKLVAVMAAMYGQKWTSQLTDAGTMQLVKNVWAKHLGGLSSQDIARGLDACVIEHRSWPPTVGEFLDLSIRSRPGPRWNDRGRMVVDVDGYLLDEKGESTGELYDG